MTIYHISTRNQRTLMVKSVLNPLNNYFKKERSQSKLFWPSNSNIWLRRTLNSRKGEILILNSVSLTKWHKILWTNLVAWCKYGVISSLSRRAALQVYHSIEVAQKIPLPVADINSRGKPYISYIWNFGHSKGMFLQ